VALIKPQFEAGRAQVGKGGVVRDTAVRQQVLSDLLTWAEAQHLTPQGLTRSSIEGSDGNVEYLVWLRPLAAARLDIAQTIAEVTAEVA
jgi:23S rRNA (cytidine1920-2'-O)/16S rRNA (cytidine1409-2'-O)-methyltransferase